MVHGDPRDGYDARFYGRRRIESAAHAGFENSQFNAGFAKRHQRNRSQVLEKRGQRFELPARNHTFRRVADGRRMTRELVLADLLPGNSNALGY